MDLYPKRRPVATRESAETSEKYGSDPYNRSVETLLDYGMVTIDKPSGPSSHQVTAYLKQILDINKAGHGGTLDPAVTGVLPMGLGKGTRITHSLLKAGKEYVCEMDVHEPVDEAQLVTLFESYEGVIEQLPPVRSAVKREPRERTIYYLDILDVQGRHVLFRVGCEAGTYIRKLCHDIGDDLGVGAHMAELRRTKVGPFTEDAASTLQDVEDAVYVWREERVEAPLQRILTPVERGVEHLKKVWVFDTAVNSLCHGASLKMPGISKLHGDIDEGDYVAVMTLKDELIETGFAQATSDEMLDQDRGVAVKPKQVYMCPGTYPKS